MNKLSTLAFVAAATVALATPALAGGPRGSVASNHSSVSASASRHGTSMNASSNSYAAGHSASSGGLAVGIGATYRSWGTSITGSAGLVVSGASVGH